VKSTCAQAGKQLQIHYKEIYQPWQSTRNICARVISKAIEFTLANWNLVFHLSVFLQNMHSTHILTEHMFIFKGDIPFYTYFILCSIGTSLLHFFNVLKRKAKFIMGFGCRQFITYLKRIGVFLQDLDKKKNTRLSSGVILMGIYTNEFFANSLGFSTTFLIGTCHYTHAVDSFQ